MEYEIEYHEKSKLEVIVSDDLELQVVEALWDVAFSKGGGDNKIFVSSLKGLVDIRAILRDQRDPDTCH